MKCELWRLEQRSWARQIDQPTVGWVLRGSIVVAIWVYVKATRWVSCGGGMGSEMGLPSHVVAKWAAARWVSPSRTLILSRLSVSLCNAYSLLYRSLSPLSFCLASQFFFSFFIFSFVFLFRLLGLHFFGFAFLFKDLYELGQWFMILEGALFFFNLKIKLLFFFFRPREARAPTWVRPWFWMSQNYLPLHISPLSCYEFMRQND